MTFISNARMYAVSPEAEVAWQRLIAHVADDAGISLTYETYAAPQPLEYLWRRQDVGCVQMCGYPIAMKIADIEPLAAPVPAAPWAAGRAVYRSDLIVRADSDFDDFTDTFQGTVGWTVAHSHSGFNALRHHLLKHRTSGQSKVFRHAIGDLVTARRIIDAVLEGTIDIGPLDGYWHMLIRKYDPDLTAGIRVLESTDTAPMPAFVASPAMNADEVMRLREAFAAACARPWFGAFRDALLIDGFVPASHETYLPTLAWDREAQDAGYPVPA
jgi:ABC-type phosphate/phosphonate transport system substrate-binding protein